MSNGPFTLPPPRNEPTLSHAPGTPERAALLSSLAELSREPIEIPLVIAGSMANLIRWTSLRTVKETFDPPRALGYPHQG